MCLSFRLRVHFRRLASIPAGISQNVTNKSCLVSIESKKYAFWVALITGVHFEIGVALVGQPKSS